MQRQQHRPKSHTTISNSKRAVVGDTAGRVAPAWRSTGAQPPAGAHSHAQNGRRDPRKGANSGSKMFMSQLPPDVQESDIEVCPELFRETIGPVFDVFLVYNSQGRSKGMAVVNFQRPGDALEARKKFNGKFIDGSRPLKIEIISDPPEPEKTLAERLGDAVTSVTKTRPPKVHHLTPQKPAGQRPQWRNLKKGPRRLKKSVEQLDREMEVYRAEAAQVLRPGVSIPGGVGSDTTAMQV